MAGGKDAEELVVQVVAVGEHDERGVRHLGLPHELAGVEGHGEALAATLGVPHDADAVIAGDGSDCRRDGLFHRPVLVVRGHDLGDLGAVDLEDDEVTHGVEEAALLEDAPRERSKLRRALFGDGRAVDRAPRHEALPGAGERAVARLDAIARDEQLVGGEQAGDLLLVGLQLVEGLPGRGLGIARVLELDDGQRQPIDEHDHVRPSVGLALDHGELVDRQPVVGLRVVEVEQPGLVAGDRAVGPRVLDVDTVDEQAMEAAVVLEQARTLGDEDLLERVVERRRRRLRIDALEGGAQTPREDDFGEVVPLGRRLLRLDVRPVGGLVAQLAEPCTHGFFDVRLDDPRRRHAHLPPLECVHARTLRSRSYKVRRKKWATLASCAERRSSVSTAAAPPRRRCRPSSRRGRKRPRWWRSRRRSRPCSSRRRRGRRRSALSGP